MPKKYIGKTEHTFKTNYNKHIQAIRSNKQNSKYARHILGTVHTYGSLKWAII